jgi:hypothetical protein
MLQWTTEVCIYNNEEFLSDSAGNNIIYRVLWNFHYPVEKIFMSKQSGLQWQY